MATITSTVLMDRLTDGPGFRDVLSDSLQGCRQDRPQSCPEMISALYASHYRYVLAVCRHYFWRREDAEDAAAEVFLKLHTVLKNVEQQPTSFRPWLSTVTGRHCIDKLRRRQCEGRYRVDVKEFAALPDVSTPSPLSQILRQEEEQHLREELRRLPRHYRVPLVLRYYRRMSYAEIAQTLGKQIPAIKMTIFRAKRELRERLRRLREPQIA